MPIMLGIDGQKKGLDYMSSEKYKMGDVLCVDKGAYEHVGISDGKGKVYENSKNKGVRYVSEKAFSAGKNINIINLGKLGSKEPKKIIQKAKEIMASPKEYNLISNNCEHFIREVCGADIKSPQIQKAVFAGISAYIATQESSPELKGIAIGAAMGALLSKSSDDAIKNSIIGASLGLLAVLFVK